MSFTGVLVTGFMSNHGLPVFVAILVALAVGASIGLVNGLLMTKVGVNSFIATLGTGTVLLGLTFALNQGLPVSTGIPSSFLSLGLNAFLAVPVTVIVLIALGIVLWLFLNRTVLGQYIQAVGGNRDAARLAGINVDRSQILAFVITATCAGLGGILLAAKLGSGQVNAGDGFLLDAFAGCFLGSVALRDGEFHVVGTLIGVLTVGVGLNGLALWGLATFWGNVFSGSLLVVAVGLSTLARRLSRR